MIHLIVGNTGAGKTTYAQKLKDENQGIIFSVDKWNKELFFPDKPETITVDWILERIERSESIIIDLIIQLESAGTDSILDLGFAKKSHRKKFTLFARKHNYDYKIHYLDITSEIRWERVQQRNTQKGASFEFEVSRENYNFMEEWFEPLDDTEKTKAVTITK